MAQLVRQVKDVKLLLVALALSMNGCAARPVSGSRPAGSDAALLAEFRDRIDRYMALRGEAADQTPDIETSTDPAEFRGARTGFASEIRARRAGAKHGDILTAEIRVLFRRLLAPAFKGDEGRDIRASLKDDAPAPGAVPLEVNASYPEATPFPTTPAPLLAALPMLPRGLEYRIIGRDLVLLDSPANLILDFIRNAIPQRRA